MLKWMEFLKEDINQEEGVIISLLSNFTSYLFKGVIFLALPIYIYYFFSFI